MWLLKGSEWEGRGRDGVWKRVILGAGGFRGCFPDFIPFSHEAAILQSSLRPTPNLNHQGPRQLSPLQGTGLGHSNCRLKALRHPDDTIR